MNETYTPPSAGRMIALLMIGFGLLALGISFMLLTDPYTFASTQDFSTVPVQVDFPAPELNLTTLNGDPASLSDYLGQVVLVNLWATWCPPCREEMPTLKAFHEKYQSEGFVLIAISQGETRDIVLPFINEFDLTFPIWLDTGSQAGRSFNTMNLPSSYVIDRNGRVRLMWIGGISKRNLEKFVPDVIKE
ncbi:MAG: redoxin domain-containing protein [Anaerolineae bacterium]|nr:redoxin domain-containing protein [Anaerolineae bacterium]